MGECRNHAKAVAVKAGLWITTPKRRLAPVDERGDLEVFARGIEAWNSGDLELVTAELTGFHE